MSILQAPLIAIVGRPNVGKSTLFNALARKRAALVADKEGVTRDRRLINLQPVELARQEVRLMDTGGWMPISSRKDRQDKEILDGIEQQIIAGLRESKIIFLVVDIRSGIHPLDMELAKFLRSNGHQFYLVCNKCDSSAQEGGELDFYSLGAKEVLTASAEHRLGLQGIWDQVKQEISSGEENQIIPAEKSDEKSDEKSENKMQPLRICIVGRPNVGKSSFLNALLGEKRVVESSIAGTTTDSVDIPLKKNGHDFLLIDTAGIRRNAKRTDDVEHLSVMYAKRNLEKVDLAILIVDAADGITSQDAKIASLVYDSGAATILIANKWDLAPEYIQKNILESMKSFSEKAKENIPFLDYAPIFAISAKENKVYGAISGIDQDDKKSISLPETLEDLWEFFLQLEISRKQNISSMELNEILQSNLAAGPNIAQTVGQIIFAHRASRTSPVFFAYMKTPQKVPEAYKRYLAKIIRKHYGFTGNPIHWLFRERKEIKKHRIAYQEYKAFLSQNGDRS